MGASALMRLEALGYPTVKAGTGDRERGRD
jgi:hypothetical protein